MEIKEFARGESQLKEEGFVVVENIYSAEGLEQIIVLIDNAV